MSSASPSPIDRDLASSAASSIHMGAQHISAETSVTMPDTHLPATLHTSTPQHSDTEIHDKQKALEAAKLPEAQAKSVSDVVASSPLTRSADLSILADELSKVQPDVVPELEEEEDVEDLLRQREDAALMERGVPVAGKREFGSTTPLGSYALDESGMEAVRQPTPEEAAFDVSLSDSFSSDIDEVSDAAGTVVQDSGTEPSHPLADFINNAIQRGESKKINKIPSHLLEDIATALNTPSDIVLDIYLDALLNQIPKEHHQTVLKQLFPMLEEHVSTDVAKYALIAYINKGKALDSLPDIFLAPVALDLQNSHAPIHALEQLLEQIPDKEHHHTLLEQLIPLLEGAEGTSLSQIANYAYKLSRETITQKQSIPADQDAEPAPPQLRPAAVGPEGGVLYASITNAGDKAVLVIKARSEKPSGFERTEIDDDLEETSKTISTKTSEDRVHPQGSLEAAIASRVGGDAYSPEHVLNLFSKAFSPIKTPADIKAAAAAKTAYEQLPTVKFVPGKGLVIQIRESITNKQKVNESLLIEGAKIQQATSKSTKEAYFVITIPPNKIKTFIENTLGYGPSLKFRDAHGYERTFFEEFEYYATDKGQYPLPEQE